MKKAWTAVLVLGLIAAVVAIGQEVTSVNAVGFNKITVPPGKLALVTLNFESFSDSSVADLMDGQLPVGTVYIWDRANREYIGVTPGRGGWDATNIIHRGDAFWLHNQDATTTTVSFMGEVPYTYNNSATTTIINLSGVDAVGYAYPTDVAWTNTSLAADPNVTTVYFWNEDTQDYTGITPGRGGWDTDRVIPAGRAFWVETTTDIDWTEIAPYDL